MVNLILVIIFAGIIGSISLAIYYFIQFQPNLIYTNAGEPIQVGPVRYIIEYVGEHNGNEKTRPEHTFFQIRIIAENLDEKKTIISGGQFYVLDENDVKIQPTFGNFSDKDLLMSYLEPNKPVTFTTQFDIQYDENKQYRIGILPKKEQPSTDIGIVCVTNC